MREIRPSGSEGGVEQTNAPSLPPIKPAAPRPATSLLRTTVPNSITVNTHIVLYAAGSLLLALTTAQAGSRSGGSGATAVTIPADTISSGGGLSAAGSGAGAVTVTASMGGVIGTVTAASPSATNQQGYIPQILPAPGPSGYDLWALQNIAAGKDATFTGDWNGDGVSNAIAYVFGNTRIQPVGGQPSGTGKVPVPPSVPADVNVYLELSAPSLSAWEQIVRWENGNAPVFQYPGLTSITGGYVVDTDNSRPFFYRYRITRR